LPQVGGASDNDYECQQHFSQIIQKSATILESIVGAPANLTPLFGRVGGVALPRGLPCSCRWESQQSLQIVNPVSCSVIGWNFYSYGSGGIPISTFSAAGWPLS